jgi:hypothetical protein
LKLSKALTIPSGRITYHQDPNDENIKRNPVCGSHGRKQRQEKTSVAIGKRFDKSLPAEKGEGNGERNREVELRGWSDGRKNLFIRIGRPPGL